VKQFIATHGLAWSVAHLLGRSFGLLDTFMSSAKMAEPIKMSFGMLTQVGPRNHTLDRGTDPPKGKAIFGGCQAP